MMTAPNSQRISWSPHTYLKLRLKSTITKVSLGINLKLPQDSILEYVYFVHNMYRVYSMTFPFYEERRMKESNYTFPKTSQTPFTTGNVFFLFSSFDWQITPHPLKIKAFYKRQYSPFTKQ